MLPCAGTIRRCTLAGNALPSDVRARLSARRGRPFRVCMQLFGRFARRYARNCAALGVLAAAILLTAGCDAVEPQELERDVVVEGYLVAGERLGTVRVTRAVAVDDAFEADAQGISDADVHVHLLRPDGAPEETYALGPDPDRPGVYRVETPPIVRPLRTYRLVVDVPGETAPVTAVTTVPDTFRALRSTRDTVVYRSEEPFTFHISRPHYPGRQSVFLITTRALQPAADRLMPLAKARFDGGDVSLSRLAETVSPLLHEENFEEQADGTLRVRYPWLALNFYGWNRVTVQALDDNVRDFFRSRTAQQGGSTLPPGEIPNVLDRVEGGRGLFGSIATASVEFVVLREAD